MIRLVYFGFVITHGLSFPFAEINKYYEKFRQYQDIVGTTSIALQYIFATVSSVSSEGENEDMYIFINPGTQLDEY